MRPPNAYIYPALQRHISRRSASKDNEDNNNNGAVKYMSCRHLWDQYYKCIENHTMIPSSCRELHVAILHTHKCPIWDP